MFDCAQKTNEDRRSGIRATAGYRRSKVKGKRKNVAKEDNAAAETDGQVEVAESSGKKGSGSKDRAKKAKGNEEKVDGMEVEEDAAPVAPSSPAESVREATSPVKDPEQTPPVDSSPAGDKKVEKTPRKRQSKSSKPKIKVTKNVEPPEKRQKMKQSTLTPSQHAEESHASVAEAVVSRDPPLEKPKKPSLTPEVTRKEVEEPPPAVEEKEGGSTSDTGTTGSETSSSSDVRSSHCLRLGRD